ncbi:MAG: alpha-N-acetylglucosaminidase N-terminal domain-containing protein [Marinilabiliaceae bacterium]|nr:alpha-N-acetylglucosaminidase N-terminal domain-containing protein [Marinilabiliaceae bacterium]
MKKILNNHHKAFIAVIGLMIFTVCSTAENINIKNDTVAFALSERVLGEELAKYFIFQLRNSSGDTDEFKISTNNNKIIIEGNNRVSLASGLNWFLKNQANSHVSWEDKRIQHPSTWLKLDQPVTKKSPFTYSYYLNYCAFNYTMAFWDWSRWEEEIDWMALNGINLPLAMVGIKDHGYGT